MTTDTPTPAAEANFLAVVKDHKPELVLLDEKARATLYEAIDKEIAAFVPDLSTDAGRRAVRSLAFKITRTKTAVDDARRAMTEEWRRKTGEVNVTGKLVTDKLDALATKVRQPLTEWEEAEKKRVALCESIIASLNALAVVALDATAAEVEERIASVTATDVEEETFRDAFDLANKAKTRTLELLGLALERLEREEKEREELEELRRADAERRQKEEAERAKAEYVESIIAHIKECGNGRIGGAEYPFAILLRELEIKVEIDDRLGDRQDEVRKLRDDTLAKLNEQMEAQAERRRAEDERLAEERRKAAAETAAEAARREEQEKAEREAEAERQRHTAELEAARRRTAEAEAAAFDAERARQAADAQRAREEEATKAERARIEADQEHRKRCKVEAKEALMTAGIAEAKANAIVLMIIANEVPRVKLDFAALPAPHLSSRAVFDEAAEEAPAEERTAAELDL
jgi:colicin import membrane protein